MIASKTETRSIPKPRADLNVQRYKIKCSNPPQPARTKKDNVNKTFVTNTPSQKTTPNYLKKRHDKCFPPVSSEQSSIVRRNVPMRMTLKSVSLIELSESSVLTAPKKWYSKEHIDEEHLINIANSLIDYPLLTSVKESDLGRKVCKTLILRCWRKRRADVKELRAKGQKLETEVENLNIQVIVLRNLLESEKVRVSVAVSDASHLRARLENELKTNSQLTKMVTQLQTEKTQWDIAKREMDNTIQSVKSALTESQNKVEGLKEECSKHLQYFTESKDREAQLIFKVVEMDTAVKNKNNSLLSLKKKCSDLQMKVDGFVSRNQELVLDKENNEKKVNECLRNIKNIEGELNNLQNLRKVQNNDIVNLTNKLKAAETCAEEKDLENKLLQHVIQCYEKKEYKLKGKLKSVALQAVLISFRFGLSQLTF